MRKKKQIPLKLMPPPNRIKVQLDARTTVYLASLKALEFWKQRYPNAKVLSN